MKSNWFIAVPFVAAIAVAACSSSPSGGGTGGGNNATCQVSATSCIIYKGYPSGSNETAGCSAAGGTVGTTCPTANLIGCCSATSDGYTSESCYYGTSGGSTSDAGAAEGDAGISGTPNYQSGCVSPDVWSSGQ